MKKMLSYLFLLFAVPLVFAQQTAIPVEPTGEYVKDVLLPATVLLYAQEEDGTLKMRCTATFIEKTKTGYVAASAAHCSCVDDEDAHTVTPEKTSFYVTEDADADKDFIKANLVGCGYRHAGDDFALFDIKTDKNFPIVPLGKDPQLLDSIVNVASPLGLGKQVFLGSIASPVLDRPLIEDDINWTNAITLQLFGTDGGSSGSSVVCVDQHAICAFVVGTANKSTVVALPVSRLIKLRDELAKGEYKNWVPNPDQISTKALKKDTLFSGK